MCCHGPMAEGNKREKMGGARSSIEPLPKEKKEKTNTQKEISIYKLNFPETIFFFQIYSFGICPVQLITNRSI
jgi:hypothetical protein